MCTWYVKMRAIRVNLREARTLGPPMLKEEDQTVVNFRDVLQGKMAMGLKSSEGKGLSSCVWRCGAGRRYVADGSWLLASASSPRRRLSLVLTQTLIVRNRW